MTPREELEAAWAAVLQGEALDAELVRDGMYRVEDARRMFFEEVHETTSPMTPGFPNRALGALERHEEALRLLDRRVQRALRAKQRIRILLGKTQEFLDKERG